MEHCLAVTARAFLHAKYQCIIPKLAAFASTHVSAAYESYICNSYEAKMKEYSQYPLYFQAWQSSYLIIDRCQSINPDSNIANKTVVTIFWSETDQLFHIHMPKRTWQGICGFVKGQGGYFDTFVMYRK